MLKRIINSINCASDAWNQSQYRYDEDSYNPDAVDSVPASQLYESYLNLCALGSRSSSAISGLGKITNTGGVKNVSLGAMNRKKGCLANAESVMDSIMDTFGNVVNQTYRAENNAGGLYLPSDIDDLAQYLRDYATDHSEEIFNIGGIEAFNMSEFGNYADNSGSGEGIPHYTGPIVDDNGEVTQGYEDYVYGLFLKPDGTCRYDGVTINPEDIKINPENGNVQVALTSQESNGKHVHFTVTCNPTNPNALANGYVGIPGTGGGGVYCGQTYASFVNDTAYASDNRYMMAIYNTTATCHDVAAKTIADIFDDLTGANNNVNRAVVSGASAGGTMTINVVRELKDVVDQPIDIMLIDAASATEAGCGEFARTLLNPAHKDVLEYLQQGSVIVAYESIKGNGGPSNANAALQQVCDAGVNVVMCVNSHYPEHTDPEYQIFAGEVDRVMSGFEEFRGNGGPVTIAATTIEQTNPYVETHPGLTDRQVDLIENQHSANQYGIFVPGGRGVASAQVIRDPVEYSDVAELFDRTPTPVQA